MPPCSRRGMFAAQKGVPAFTYSRKKNSFYDISGAAFADDLHCDLLYSIEDFFLMAGGTLLPGRVDNHVSCPAICPTSTPSFACFLQLPPGVARTSSPTSSASRPRRVRPDPAPQSICGRLHREGRPRDPEHRQRGGTCSAHGRQIDFIRDAARSSPASSVSFSLPRPARPRLAAGRGQRPGAVRLQGLSSTPASSTTSSAAPWCAGTRCWATAASPTRST